MKCRERMLYVKELRQEKSRHALDPEIFRTTGKGSAVGESR